MTRIATLATCQPSYPGAQRSCDEVWDEALRLAREAGRADADLCVLPEALNCVGLEPPQAAPRTASAFVNARLESVREIARECAMYVAAPVIQNRDGQLHNTVWLLDRRGATVGGYDKVHLTRRERNEWGIAPGNSYPVFDLDFGRVGIMVCYDACFPETARLLTLGGAEVILFPSLQRGFTERELELQVRARAYDHQCYLVRSSYGTPRDEIWRPGMLVGKSCIVAPDGEIVTDLGRWTGWVAHAVDLDIAPMGESSYGGDVGSLREIRLADRRPETYAGLACGGATRRC